MQRRSESKCWQSDMSDEMDVSERTVTHGCLLAALSKYCVSLVSWKKSGKAKKKKVLLETFSAMVINKEKTVNYIQHFVAMSSQLIGICLKRTDTTRLQIADYYQKLQEVSNLSAPQHICHE